MMMRLGFYTFVAAILFGTGCKPTPPEIPRTAPDETVPETETPPEPVATANETPTDADRPFIVNDDGDRIAVSVGAAPGYVPDTACRDCHALLYDDYQHVGMALSTFRPSTDNIIEDFENGTFYHKASDRHYEMSHRNGIFYQKRFQLDDDGHRINEMEATVDLVIGSGHRVRTYATRSPIGEYFQLPVSWYTQTGTWGMSPGYDIPDHVGYVRQIKRECLFCHNAYPEQPEGSDFYGTPFTFPETLPHGIGCQRCHGPGAAHVRIAYESQVGISEIRESIVNPARLEPKRRDDVCYQCHLQPSANPTSFMRIAGRGDYSYKPGEPLEDYVIIVDYQDEEQQRERFEINHHAYRLRQSPCYLQSHGTMTCTTCHDPHRKPAPGEATAYFRDKCLTCHAPNDCHTSLALPDGGDCMDCHMPPHRTEDVIEIVATDHLIQRRPPKEAYVAPREVKRKQKLGLPRPYFSDHVPDKDTLALHMGMLSARQHDATRLEALEALVKEQAPESVEPYLHLALGQRFVDDYQGAEVTYRAGLEKHPNIETLHSGLAHVLARLERYDESGASALTAIAINPVSPDAYHLLGVALQSLGRTPEAGRAFQQTLRLRPYHLDAQSNLGKTYAAGGDFAAAIREHTRVIELDPLDTPAYVDLATLLVFVNQRDAALARVRHGLKLNPYGARLHVTLGLILAIGGQHELAIASANRAKELGAGPASCAAIEAAHALHQGDKTAARSAMTRAHRQGATDILENMLLDRLRAELGDQIGDVGATPINESDRDGTD